MRLVVANLINSAIIKCGIRIGNLQQSFAKAVGNFATQSRISFGFEKSC
jgi:hypothetical protein